MSEGETQARTEGGRIGTVESDRGQKTRKVVVRHPAREKHLVDDAVALVLHLGRNRHVTAPPAPSAPRDGAFDT